MQGLHEISLPSQKNREIPAPLPLMDPILLFNCPILTAEFLFFNNHGEDILLLSRLLRNVLPFYMNA